MGINLDNILKSLGIKEAFDEKAEAAYTKAKETADDDSIFESKDKFIEHYSDEIFGGSDVESIAIDDFVKQAQDAGFVEEDNADKFKIAIDVVRDGEFSRDEAGELIGAVYDSAQAVTQENKPDELNNVSANTKEDKPELYENVTVQPWGTGEDDCLSRIIQKHVDGVKLYSEDYNQFVQETCKLNDIKDPNIISGDIKLPELKRSEDGTPLKDADGKLQFYSKEELEAINNENEKIVHTEKDEANNTFIRNTLDSSGNVLKSETLDSDKEDSEILDTTDYKYEDGKLTGFTTTFHSDNSVVEGKYDEKGRVLETETKYANNSTKHIKYTYNDDNNTTTQDISSPDSKETKQIIFNKNGELIYQKADYGNDTWVEAFYEKGEKTYQKNSFGNNNWTESICKDGKVIEKTEMKDGNKTHFVMTDDNIAEYEKTDADGNILESGKKDKIGTIKDVKTSDDGNTSIRTYEDDSTAEWTDNGTKIGSVYVKDSKGASVSVSGKDFVQWMNTDNAMKAKLNSWISEQDKTPANNEILEKFQEFKKAEESQQV